MIFGSRSRSPRVHEAASLVLAAIVAAGCPADDADDGASSIESGNDSGPTNTETTAAEGTTASDETIGTTGSGVIVNGCGTFDTNVPGDSAIPQDPDDPEIIDACTALCDAMATIADCTTDPVACLDACKLRSCSICPGTLAPLVACETELFDGATCECGEEGTECGTPAGCSTQLSATSQCGG
jgi:hypothetical protein